MLLDGSGKRLKFQYAIVDGKLEIAKEGQAEEAVNSWTETLLLHRLNKNRNV